MSPTRKRCASVSQKMSFATVSKLLNDSLPGRNLERGPTKGFATSGSMRQLRHLRLMNRLSSNGPRVIASTTTLLAPHRGAEDLLWPTDVNVANDTSPITKAGHC